jgi:hypothetical protein
LDQRVYPQAPIVSTGFVKWKVFSSRCERRETEKGTDVRCRISRVLCAAVGALQCTDHGVYHTLQNVQYLERYAQWLPGVDGTDFVTERHEYEFVGNTLVGLCNRGQYENGEKVDKVKSHEDSSALGRGSYMTEWRGVVEDVVVQNRTTWCTHIACD